MYAYNPDRNGLSEVKLLKLEPWRLYPEGDALNPEHFRAHAPAGPRITNRTAIASIGNCFSREIKVWLKENGYTFIETAEGPCTEAGSARYDRVYNTFTLRQEFERAFGVFDPQEKFWEFQEQGEHRLLDPYRRNVAWEDAEEMRRELAEHAENVRRAFTEADVLIITIGQAEIWYNKSDGYVYPLVPPVQIYDPRRHGFRLSGYEENLANLERVYELFAANNPNGHIIIVVSPVPLRATFRRMSSVIANIGVRSMLRVAADAFVEAHPERVTYFPAYEIVTVTSEKPYKDDNRHVRGEIVDEMMQLFEAWFVQSAESETERSRSPASHSSD